MLPVPSAPAADPNGARSRSGPGSDCFT